MRNATITRTGLILIGLVVVVVVCLTGCAVP